MIGVTEINYKLRLIMGLLFSRLWSYFTHEGLFRNPADEVRSSVFVFQNTRLLLLAWIMRVKLPFCINCKLNYVPQRLTHDAFHSLMNEVVHTSPTLGSNVEEVVWKNIHFIMWDIGGQESLRQGWNAYYVNTEVKIHSSNNHKLT